MDFIADHVILEDGQDPMEHLLTNLRTAYNKAKGGGKVDLIYMAEPLVKTLKTLIAPYRIVGPVDALYFQNAEVMVRPEPNLVDESIATFIGQSESK